jgi:Tn3 transposase DDE domain
MPEPLSDKSAGILLSMFQDIYRQEVSVEEDVHRTLPFFATALGLIHAAGHLPSWDELTNTKFSPSRAVPARVGKKSENGLQIEEHYTDTGGATDHVFGLCHVLGFRFAPRMRDIKDRRLHVFRGSNAPPILARLVGGFVDADHIAANWGEILRLATSIRSGAVQASAMLKKLFGHPGVIASDQIGDSQLEYLKAALHRVSTEKFGGALIIAHHHPALTIGSKHGWSEDMRKQIDDICADAEVWPHAVLSAHAHNYQRFTRVHQGMEIPYIVAGNGGHNIARLKRSKDSGGRPTHSADSSQTDGATRYESPFRAPTVIQEASRGNDLVRLENYDDQDYGYLRVVVTSEQLRIEYHPASDTGAAKTPDDIVAVNLKGRKLAVPTP